MRLRTLMLVSATGMVATAALVWTAIEPTPKAVAATRVDVPEPEPPPPPDRSHFEAGKTLMVSSRLGHAVLPADTDSQTFLFVDISADAAGRARNDVPLNLAIAIDRSGSMKGKRIDNAMAAARSAVKRLRDGDIVSVIAFSTTSEPLVMPTKIDADSRAKVLAALDKPRPAGDTCISCAVETSMRLLGQQDDMVSRILLLSDGFATAGVRDLPGFERIAEECRTMGASITTIGVDLDYDERILAALARDSNGGHYFVANPDGLPLVLDQEMDKLTRTVANNADLVVDLAPGVFAEEVFDRANVTMGSQLVVPFGTFTAGERKTLLVRLRVPRGSAGERPIASVRLRYDDLVTAAEGTCNGDLIAQMTTDTSKVTPLDGVVSSRVQSTETAMALEQANALFRNGDEDAARALIRKKKAEIQEARKVAAEPAAEAMPAVDDEFKKQNDALDRAGSGIKGGADSSGGRAATRDAQKDAFDLSN